MTHRTPLAAALVINKTRGSARRAGLFRTVEPAPRILLARANAVTCRDAAEGHSWRWVVRRCLTLAAVSASALGCRDNPPPPPTSPSAPAQISPSAAPADAPRPNDAASFCANVRRSSQGIVDAAAARARRESPTQTTKDHVVPDWCVGDARARWALEVVHAAYGPSASGPWELGVGLEIVALREGVERRSARIEALGTTTLDAIEKPEAVDLDGDGAPELTWIHAPDHPEGVTVANRSFYRWGKDGVAAYTFPGDTWTDADADGRMDGVSAAVRHDHTACWKEVSFKRVPLLHHQKSDGTFSVDDEVAQAFAKRTCAAPPKELIVKSRDGWIDEAESSLRIECARLWGAKVDEIGRAFDKACSRKPTEKELCELKPLKDTCHFEHVLRAIAEETQPILTIREGKKSAPDN